jgi:hypothetical protein
MSPRGNGRRYARISRVIQLGFFCRRRATKRARCDIPLLLANNGIAMEARRGARFELKPSGIVIKSAR